MFKETTVALHPTSVYFHKSLCVLLNILLNLKRIQFFLLNVIQVLGSCYLFLFNIQTKWFMIISNCVKSFIKMLNQVR